MAKQEKLGWLRDALADHNLRAKDIATAWGVDDAVVSRFISKGEPQLTFDRAQSLARMLGMDLMELQSRMQTRTVPVAALKDEVEAPENTDDVLNILQVAMDEARRRLAPRGFKLYLSIEYHGANGAAQ